MTDRPSFVLAFVGLLANVVMAAAATLAFRMWRLQIRGGAEHEITLRALRTIYQIESVLPSYATIAPNDSKVSHAATVLGPLRSDLRVIACEVRALWGLLDAQIFYKFIALVAEWEHARWLHVRNRPYSSPLEKAWPFDWQRVAANLEPDYTAFVTVTRRCVAEIEDWAVRHGNLDRRSKLRADPVLMRAARMPIAPSKPSGSAQSNETRAESLPPETESSAKTRSA